MGTSVWVSVYGQVVQATATTSLAAARQGPPAPQVTQHGATRSGEAGRESRPQRSHESVGSSGPLTHRHHVHLVGWQPLMHSPSQMAPDRGPTGAHSETPPGPPSRGPPGGAPPGPPGRPPGAPRPAPRPGAPRGPLRAPRRGPKMGPFWAKIAYFSYYSGGIWGVPHLGPRRGVPPGGPKSVHFFGYLITLPVGTKIWTFLAPPGPPKMGVWRGYTGGISLGQCL